MWQKYFKVIGITPGPVVIPGRGEIDFANQNHPVELIQDLFEKDCPHLEITPLGIQHLYGTPIDPHTTPQTPNPEPTTQPVKVVKTKTRRTSKVRSQKH